MTYDLANYEFNSNFTFHRVMNNNIKALPTYVAEHILLLGRMPVHDILGTWIHPALYLVE